MSYGRTYNEQRFSTLKDIDDHNVAQLGLAWHFDLDTRRGQEATPLVVEEECISLPREQSFRSRCRHRARCYGATIRKFRRNGCERMLRCGQSWRSSLARKIFFGTLDGRLIALDAATGNKVWETLTIEPKWRYTITGAPRVVKGNVIIGNGGAEMGVRGYVPRMTPKRAVWFGVFTVPGDPFETF